jgi:hypothetical protein
MEMHTKSIYKSEKLVQINFTNSCKREPPQCEKKIASCLRGKVIFSCSVMELKSRFLFSLEFIFTFAVRIAGKIVIKSTLIWEWKPIWDECFHGSG